MFDFAWSEIALIGVVALIAIGPKDMPVAIKAISDTVKKLRRMAGEFQGHVDEMLRDADLGEVKSSLDELRSLNPRRMVQRAIDPDGTVRSAFADPFRDHPVRPVMAPLDQPLVTPPPGPATVNQIGPITPPDFSEPAPGMPYPAVQPAPTERVASQPAPDLTLPVQRPAMPAPIATQEAPNPVRDQA